MIIPARTSPDRAALASRTRARPCRGAHRATVPSAIELPSPANRDSGRHLRPYVRCPGTAPPTPPGTPTRHEQPDGMARRPAPGMTARHRTVRVVFAGYPPGSRTRFLAWSGGCPRKGVPVFSSLFALPVRGGGGRRLVTVVAALMMVPALVTV